MYTKLSYVYLKLILKSTTIFKIKLGFKIIFRKYKSNVKKS